jgi:hypothetical protein
VRAIWSRVNSHLPSLPRGVPQIYGAVTAMAICLVLVVIDPRVFGVNWASFLVFVGFSAAFAVGNFFYTQSRSVATRDDQLRRS